LTDIEGSTRLWQQRRKEMHAATTRHDALAVEVVSRHDGTLVKDRGEGDSLFCVFAQATDAVTAACALQQVFLAEPWATGTPLRVRMALHTGEADQRDGDYYGPTVNRCARIRAAGHGGQILLSDATRALSQSDLPPDATLRDCGTHRLRDVGEEHLWQLLHPALPSDFPPLLTLDPQRHNLPLPPTPFLGREAETADWYALLLQPTTRLLTLSGFGGMGKTRAALHLAERCLEDFPNGVWWVGLEEARSSEEMIQRIALQLRLSLQPSPSVKEQVGSFLRDRRLLLALDNVEQVADAADVVNDLLNTAPGIRCLVTSRRALGLRAEAVVEIPPLPAADAERLFVERARACQSDFGLTAENAADIAQLCRRLEGMPLAIELAAARIVGMTPRQMLPRLNERFRLLQTRAPDLPPRQRALHAAIDWSYCLLTPEDRALFAQLGVFVGGFTLEDAEAVCEAWDVFEGVMELRRNSLFRAETDPHTQETRFLMPESLREYANERLRETEDMGRAVRQRHADYFQRFAQARLDTLRTPQEAAALQQMETNDGNLRAAMEWARETTQPALQAKLALAVGLPLQRRGFHREAVGPIQAGLDALTALQAAQPALYARLLRERAGLHLDHLEWAEARQRAQEALVLFQQSGDLPGQAHAENLLGQAAIEEQAFAEARDHFAHALAQYERTQDALHAAIVHNNLGIVECRDTSGDRTRARQHLEEALRLRRLHADWHGLAETLNNLGFLAFEQGDMDEAERCYTEALQHERTLRHTFGIARALCNLGEVAAARDENEPACRLFAASEYLFHEVKSPYAAYATDLLTDTAAKQSVPLADLRQAVQDTPLETLIAWTAAAGP
jgi:predicted ATPase/class 3 adenylate cyclase